MVSRRKAIIAAAAFPLLLIRKAKAGPPFTHPSFWKARPAGGGGPPAWQDIIDPGSTDTGGFSGSGVAAFPRITNSTTGTCSKLRLYSTQNLECTLKLALYNSSKALIGSGSVAVPQAVPYNDWIEVDIAPTAVTASQNYYIGHMSSVDNAVSTRYLNGVGTSPYQIVAYASFPVDPFAEDGTASVSYATGIYVTPT